jgi:hypothetical protein
MNRDERDARREDSLRGVSELAREIDRSGSLLATLAVEQLLKPAISDIVSPIRRKAVSRGTQEASKGATRMVTKQKAQTVDRDEKAESSEEEA